MSRLAKKHPLSFAETIALFYNCHEVDPHIIADLILWKTKQDLEPEQYNSSYQQGVVDDAKDWFRLQDPVWEWNESNIGMYIAKDQQDYQMIFDAVKIGDDRLMVHQSVGYISSAQRRFKLTINTVGTSGKAERCQRPSVAEQDHLAGDSRGHSKY